MVGSWRKEIFSLGSEALGPTSIDDDECSGKLLSRGFRISAGWEASGRERRWKVANTSRRTIRSFPRLKKALRGPTPNKSVAIFHIHGGDRTPIATEQLTEDGDDERGRDEPLRVHVATSGAG
jgi:hypothetical protein